MSKHSARLIARTLRIKSYGHYAYGILNGVFVNIHNDIFAGGLSVNTGELDRDTMLSAYDYLESNKKRLLVKSFVYKKPYLTVRLDSRYGALTAKRMASSCHEITGFLQYLGVSSSCAVCGYSQCSAAATSEGVLYLCGICLKQAEAESGGALLAQKTTGSYVKGVLGAAAGGLLGVIPWILLGMLGIIGAVSGLVMSVLCTKMYIAFKGRTGKAMAPIIVFALVVFTAAGVFAAWFVRALMAGVSGMDSIMLYIFDDMTITGIFGDMIIGLFLAGIGAFSMIRGVIKAASGEGLSITRLPV